MARTAPTFEKQLEQLEALVGSLEQGELSLDESLKAFERGIRLARQCQQTLDQAEQKVRILLDESPTADPEPFDADDL